MSKNISTEVQPPKTGVSRRDFLKISAAAATATVVASCTGNMPNIAPAMPAASVTTPMAGGTPATTAEVYIFFNQSEAATLKAICGQLIPGSSQDPGAIEAGAHIYIDHALGGFYSGQQLLYRRGLAAVDAYSQLKFKGNFAVLSTTQQQAILSDMQSGAATGFYGPGATDFFNILVTHTREGTFCDPVYGGNQNAVGWKMIGFPGAQLAYGDADMAVGTDQSKKSILTLADMESIPMPMPQNGF